MLGTFPYTIKSALSVSFFVLQLFMERYGFSLKNINLSRLQSPSLKVCCCLFASQWIQNFKSIMFIPINVRLENLAKRKYCLLALWGLRRVLNWEGKRGWDLSFDHEMGLIKVEKLRSGIQQMLNCSPQNIELRSKFVKICYFAFLWFH